MSSSSLETPIHNYSILALPAYMTLAYSLHFVSIAVAKNFNLRGSWDQSNPRGTQNADVIRKRLSPERFRTYERVRACHANYFETMPTFYGAVILGNVARLPLGGKHGLNRFALSYLGLRVVHMVLYIGTDRGAMGGKLSYVRAPVFIYGLWMCMEVMFRAAKELVY
ncbi:hypothetical protein MKZ38_004780 [Zalerion maritima]|uniref:Uncharacterized protein n=1 Tax=Zalerion maritima TaxID=339359 RepID=A0AAD5WRF1_9PEZI|nr:hypothetical protein MKZ38_004780 [Zalerion maritima]